MSQVCSRQLCAIMFVIFMHLVLCLLLCSWTWCAMFAMWHYSWCDVTFIICCVVLQCVVPVKRAAFQFRFYYAVGVMPWL